MGGKRLIGSVGLADSGVPDDLLTTKGDMHGFSSANARIPVGTNNYSVLADSSQTLGLKWGASATSVLSATGDILYASGANTLARLAKGDNDKVLTLKAGLPSWESSAGGGKLELVNSTTLGSDAGDIDTSFTALDLTEVSCLVVDCMLSMANGNSVAMIINDSTSSEYQQDGTTTTGGATSIIERVNVADLLLYDGNAVVCTSHCILYPATTTTKARGVNGILQTAIGQPSTGQYDAYCVNMDVNGTTDIDQITVTGGENLLAGSIMNIYKVSL
tara:strand:+ start:93 stop:917 length:825 start_codon:yes stop_codon:yes gene_type:complete